MHQFKEESSEPVQVTVKETQAVQVPEFDEWGVLIAAPQVATCTRFHDLTFSFLSTYTQHIKTCKLWDNQLSEENYTPVFLEHVCLYIFTNKYIIKSLKTLILIKLHDTLCKFFLYKAYFEDILKLVHYMYKNTLSHTLRDSLCELITHYIAYEVKKVAASEQGLELVKKNESFAWDLLSMILKRVV